MPNNLPLSNVPLENVWLANLSINVPLSNAPRETTEVMDANVGRELAEVLQALGRCCGDRRAEPQLTGTWMAHLLIFSRELLQNLLSDTALRPGR